VVKHKALVPFTHVANVNRSVEFYRKLGFEIGSSHPSDSPDPMWVWLHAGGANLMLNQANKPVVASQQAIFFYLYVEDVASFRDSVIAAGIEAGPLQHTFYLPLGEFIVHDPDGYAVMIAQRD
jgi:catechol 2,3-dioxygenase-like lactoylglutathione lyase family enzyme